MKPIRTAEHCATMAEVRQAIDALDDRITALIAERSSYMTAAARIKDRADQVHDQARIDCIVERVKAMARAGGAPDSVVEAAYRAMIAASIEFEHGEFRRLRRKD